MSVAAGLDPAKVKKVVTGADVGSLEFLKRGEVDGFITFIGSETSFRQMKIDLHYLNTDNFAPLPGDSYFVTKETAEKEAAAVTSFLRACRKAWEFMADPANADKVLEAVGALNEIEVPDRSGQGQDRGRGQGEHAQERQVPVDRRRRVGERPRADAQVRGHEGQVPAGHRLRQHLVHRRALRGSGHAAQHDSGVRAMTARHDGDLVVIGAGTAGLPAAIEAARQGSGSPSSRRPIGSAARCGAPGAQLSAGGTSLQRAKGILDSPDLHFDDVMRISKNTADPASSGSRWTTRPPPSNG